jgi:L-rhamnose isomerase
LDEYSRAIERYNELGVKADECIEQLEEISLSIHCWQGDDVSGFESHDATLAGGGILATGNYPGKARSIEELRQDLEFALSLIPGNHRINLHAIYGDFTSGRRERDEITIENFQSWVDWALERDLGIDFNATLFSHPKADSGFTLSSKDKTIRDFWIGHVQRCREISSDIGKQLQTPVIHNLWIPDGSKDIPVDRMGHRILLKESLDEIYSVKFPKTAMKDALEGKLFGIESESFVVGSHDFYLSYAIANDLMLTMDTGHYHPTESVADKISSILPFTDEIFLHVSRGVRWDSDHVILLSDDLVQLAEELVRRDAIRNVHIALDYFDASINRIGAWIIGARATQKSILYALLQPWDLLREYEESGKNFQRLALLEELKSLPFGAVWNHFCDMMKVPAGLDWIEKVEEYEESFQRKRL